MAWISRVVADAGERLATKHRCSSVAAPSPYIISPFNLVGHSAPKRRPAAHRLTIKLPRHSLVSRWCDGHSVLRRDFGPDFALAHETPNMPPCLVFHSWRPCLIYRGDWCWLLVITRSRGVRFHSAE